MSADLIALTQWFNNHEFDSVDEMQGAFLAIKQLRTLSSHPKEAAPSDEQVTKALDAFNEFPCPMNSSISRSWNREQMRAALAATQAPEEKQ